VIFLSSLLKQYSPSMISFSCSSSSTPYLYPTILAIREQQAVRHVMHPLPRPAAHPRKFKRTAIQSRSHAAYRDDNAMVSPGFSQRLGHSLCQQVCGCACTLPLPMSHPRLSKMLWYDFTTHFGNS
jgi:hypothetical protein